MAPQRPDYIDTPEYRKALTRLSINRVANITLLDPSDCRYCWKPIKANEPVDVVELRDANLIHAECAIPMAASLETLK